MLTIAGGILIAMAIVVGVVIVLRFILGLIFGTGPADDKE